MNLLEIFGCLLAVSYLVAASFALVRTWEPGQHAFRRLSARDTVRVALEAVAWPAEESWLQLQQFFSREWAAAVPRWQEVGS